jgi:CYTH domain-containing protein/predicted ATPase
MIVITGGPCAGKSTLLSYAQQKLSDLGWTVVIVSEAATEFIMGGLRPWEIKSAGFQYQLMQHIINKENTFRATANLCDTEKIVILCDRGTMDARAYMRDFDFERLIHTLGTDLVELCDKRYEAVIALHSVAIDKPELFTCENNSARTEDVQKAIRLNKRTLEAWTGHPHVSVIDNSGTFDSKLNRAFRAICHVLAIPAPLEIEYKFKLKPEFHGLPQMPHGAVQVTIDQYYLKCGKPNVEERIRARRRDRGELYYHTYKELVSPGVRIERESQIPAGEYFALMDRIDPECAKIEKWRHCFIANNNYFELDSYYHVGEVYLEVEVTDANEQVTLPRGYDEIFEDVTGDPHHSNYEISRRLAAMRSNR